MEENINNLGDLSEIKEFSSLGADKATYFERDARGNPVMSPELKAKVENLSTFQRKYCEFRAKGLKQADAAAKAGSGASSRENLSRTGYNIEQVPGAQEYIQWLIAQRARSSVIDKTEIMDRIRRVYDAAMDDGKYNDANKAAELLGQCIGLFGKGGNNQSTPQGKDKEVNSESTNDDGGNKNSNPKKIKNNVGVFKKEDEEDDKVSKQQKLREIQSLIRDLNSSKK